MSLSSGLIRSTDLMGSLHITWGDDPEAAAWNLSTWQEAGILP
ncbi:MAG: hypothetical protein WCD49_12345 [Candidatus Acidiferrales bacterium]